MKLIDTIKTNENIFLYGEGGIGKTYTFVDLFETLLSEVQTHKIIPIYIPLRKYDGDKDFLKNYMIYNYIYTLAKEDADNDVGLYKKLKEMIETSSYRFLLLCDGINEISINCKEIYTEIDDFSEWANIQIIVSSRYDVKDELRSFVRCKNQQINESYVRDNIEEYDSLPKNLQTLLLTPFYYTIYQKTNLEKRMTASNAGQLLKLHYRNMILRSNRTDHREFSELIVFGGFVPYLCFNLSLTGSLSITEKESDQLFDKWLNTLSRTEKLKILNEFGIDRYNYIENICGFGIASYENKCIQFHEINRDFFAAYYEKDKTKIIDGEEWAEASNLGIYVFVAEILNINYGKITIPYGVKVVQDYAFSPLYPYNSLPIGEEKVKVTKFHLPDTLLVIGKYAFEYCDITNIDLPDSLLSIEFRAFYACQLLEKIEFPNGLLQICGSAFLGTKIKEVFIPKNVQYIGHTVFSGCDYLSRIIVSADNEKYYSVNNCIINKNNKTLIAGCNKSTIPTDKNVVAIGAWAFWGCHKIEKVVIPNNILEIGERAFQGCINLSEVTLGEKIKTIHEGTFYGINKLRKIYIPYGVEKIETEAFAAATRMSFNILNTTKGPLNEAILPDSVRVIEKDAFYAQPSLVIKCSKQSYAHQYAIKNHIKYELI